MVFAARLDNETVVAQGPRVRWTLALVRSTSVNAREEFVNRVFNATINIRRCVVLKTRPAKLAPFMFLGHALKLVSCLDKLEPTPAGRSKKREASAHRCIYTRHGLETFFVLRTI